MVPQGPNPQQVSVEPDATRLTTAIDKIPFVLIVAGLVIVPLGAFYFGFGDTVRYASELLSFGVLTFMVGVTYLSLDRKVEKTFVGYMWAAAFIIIGSLTGVSLYTLLGGIVKPP